MSMQDIKVGSIVRVSVEEGHNVFTYDLKVESIEDEYTDDDGKYVCEALGIGVTSEDEELAEELTHRIDATNFIQVIK